MPTIDEAVERARLAVEATACIGDFGINNADEVAKAALSAFLADVPVSDTVRQSGVDCIRHFDLEPQLAERIYKAMSAKLAEEIQ